MKRRRAAVLIVAATLVLIVAAILGLVGCTRDSGSLTELQRIKSGTMDVVLLSTRDRLKHGTDTFVIEFRESSGGALLDVGSVKASATMPMPGMPMFGQVDVKRTDVAGRYEATASLEMAGTWRLTLEWQGPAGQGSVTFSGNIQ